MFNCKNNKLTNLIKEKKYIIALIITIIFLSYIYTQNFITLHVYLFYICILSIFLILLHKKKFKLILYIILTVLLVVNFLLIYYNLSNIKILFKNSSKFYSSLVFFKKILINVIDDLKDIFLQFFIYIYSYIKNIDLIPYLDIIYKTSLTLIIIFNILILSYFIFYFFKKLKSFFKK